MAVTLLYFDGCPGWATTETRIREALQRVGLPDAALTLRTVETPMEAEAVGFRGSPTVLIDGIDPFAEPDAPVGLSCRLYETPDGLLGAPTIEQLVRALS